MSELKLAVNHQWSDDKNHYQVTSNWDDVSSGCWDDNYVNFTGYFGKYGPDVFAAAPELYEALVETEQYFSNADGLDEAEYDYRYRVRSALAKARGETL